MSHVKYQDPVQDMSSDDILQLPSDKLPPTHLEIQMVDTLFKKQKSMIDRIFLSAKNIILMGILFIVLNIPQIDGLIFKIFPSSEKSQYILILLKACIFMASFYLIENIYLTRK
jgi:hypothetical protein